LGSNVINPKKKISQVIPDKIINAITAADAKAPQNYSEYNKETTNNGITTACTINMKKPLIRKPENINSFFSIVLSFNIILISQMHHKINKMPYIYNI